MSDKKTKDWEKFKEEVEKQLQNEEQTESTEEYFDADAENNPSALEHPNYKELEDKLTHAEQQAHENWEKAVRAMAELDNVRRRSERDVANAHQYGTMKLIERLLPTIDSLEQALQIAENEQNHAMAEGLQLTMKLMMDALEKEGVKPLNPLGEIFDSQYHEAMGMQDSPHAKANEIIAVIQKGYLQHDRVVRPARVIVAKV